MIVFAINLGMGMARNSIVQEPDFKVARYGVTAWTNTRVYIENLADGDLGSFDHAVLGTLKAAGRCQGVPEFQILFHLHAFAHHFKRGG